MIVILFNEIIERGGLVDGSRKTKAATLRKL